MLPAAASQGSFFLQRQEGTLGRVAGSVEGASLVFASPSMAPYTTGEAGVASEIT